MVADRTAGGGEIAIDLSAMCDRLICVRNDRREHLLVLRAGKAIRLDIEEGSVLDGPVVLRPQLAAPVAAARLDALNRLMVLAGSRGTARWQLRSDARLIRLVEALRAWDAHQAGASLSAIGAVLLGQIAMRRWPGENDTLKSRIRRRVALGYRLIDAGPKAVLARRI